MTAAETARQKGQWDRAIEQYRAALAVDGHREDPKARQGLHDAYVGQGDAALRAGRHETRVAVAAYTDATRVAGVNTEEANRKLRQAEQALANWKTYSQHLEGGRIALGRNDWDGAIQAFGAAAAVDGYGDDPDAVKGLAAALIGKGHQHLGQRQWQAAKQALDQARKLPGRDKDTTVRDGIAKADEGIGHDAAYARHMEEARKALMDKDYAAAATGFRKALDVPGYGNDAAAKGELREAEEKKAAASAAPRPDLQDEKRFAQDMKDLKDADVYAARKPGATRDKWLRVRNKAQEIIDQYGARRDVSEARDILSEAKQNLDRLRE
jgi:hypothetical protein